VAGLWVSRVELPRGHFFVHGYALPLNTAASYQLARDKVATSLVLAAAGVPCVPHRLVMAPEVAEAWYGSPRDVTAQLEECLEAFGEDLVLKPNHGFGGQDVQRTQSRREAGEVLAQVLGSARDHAVAPYIPDAREVRVVLLDEAILCIYEKVRGEDWRHNLARGAQAVPVTDPSLAEACGDLARRAAGVLGLRLAAVDLFLTRDGLSVIEVNSGVVLEKMARQLPGGMDIARRAYGEILGAVERDLDRLHGSI